MNPNTRDFSKRTIYKTEEYPRNLLLMVKDDLDLEMPAELTEDVLDGVQYVLSKFPPRSQDVIYQRYQLKRTRNEIGKQYILSESTIVRAEYKVLRELRYPKNWNYIRYGLKKYSQILEEKEAALANIPVTKLSIDRLELSPRAYAGMVVAGCRVIEDVAALSELKIWSIWKFGPKCRREVALALHKQGIYGTEWENFLPRNQRMK